MTLSPRHATSRAWPWRRQGFFLLLLATGVCLAAAPAPVVPRFTVASFNLENYLLENTGTRPAKPETARRAVRDSILSIRPDVLALQEVGGTNALEELRGTLRLYGLDYPHWEWVAGHDTNIQVAVLSRFPFTARRPHPREAFLLGNRRFFVSRGFAEVEVSVTPEYRFTLLAAHLKSRREVPEADQGELREEEAKILRRIVDDRLQADPGMNLVVAGDLNDVKDSRVVRTLVGRGKAALTDARPVERTAAPAPDAGALSNAVLRDVSWTYFYRKEDTYSRIDYLLLSRGMTAEWETNATFVLSRPDWGKASDHRPVVAGFVARDR